MTRTRQGCSARNADALRQEYLVVSGNTRARSAMSLEEILPKLWVEWGVTKKGRVAQGSWHERDWANGLERRLGCSENGRGLGCLIDCGLRGRNEQAPFRVGHRTPTRMPERERERERG